jgi:hypothetical protein
LLVVNSGTSLQVVTPQLCNVTSGSSYLAQNQVVASGTGVNQLTIKEYEAEQLACGTRSGV